MPSELLPADRRAAADTSVPLGTASWMLPDEARSRFGFSDRLFALNEFGLWDGRSDGQIFLGEAIDSAAGALGYTDDRHVCLVSGTRGGKGTGIIIPNLCLWPGSCIVVDPKGENATVTARRRGGGSEYCFGLGQTVQILDPFGEVQIDASLKARYNPLDAIDPASDFAVDDAGRVAAALVVVESRTDPYWEEAGRDLIKGLILHVLTDPDFEGRRNLVSVWRLLNQGDWISLEMLRGAGEKDIPSGFNLLWQGMKRSAAYGGLVAGTGEQFAAMAERTRSSILGSARSSLEFISGPPMQRILEASDFDLAALKTDPRGLSLYLTLPQRYMSTHFRWLRLMVSLAVGEMERIKGPLATGYPTLFLLDEFAGLKRMEAIEHAAAQAAGFGAKFFFVVQNLTQLKETYKDSWETFLGNSGLKIFFQIEDDFTRSYVTRQLGEQEVRRAVRSGSQSQSSSGSVTQGESLSSTFGTSSSSTKGRNFGRSTGRTRGSSRGSALTYDGPLRIFSTGESTNKGRNRSDSNSSSVGWSTSVSASQSRSQSTSTSSSRSASRSESITEGWSEGVHKRSLLNPDEVGRFLARVDDRTDLAYPGILLALTPGRNPLLVRRINYFESSRFAGFFDPHPPFPPPETLEELAAQAKQRLVDHSSKQKRRRRIRVPVLLGGIAFGAIVLAVSIWVTRDRTGADDKRAGLSAEQVIPSAEAAYSRGDFAEAARLFTIAANQNDGRAEYMVGMLYLKGQGLSLDQREAVNWLQRAAQHYPPAEEVLGICYEYGNGVPQDYNKAAQHVRKAAEQNVRTAQGRFGFFYQEGLGVPKDYNTAMQWYLKAANQGEPISKFLIGRMYEDGLGVVKDPELARSWIAKSALDGHAEAKAWLDRH